MVPESVDTKAGGRLYVIALITVAALSDGVDFNKRIPCGILIIKYK